MRVTPYVGVWIETAIRYTEVPGCQVTPYVGVWIETVETANGAFVITSLLMWECGLKHSLPDEDYTDAMSLLMWECGLKPVRVKANPNTHLSLLMWECGLKLNKLPGWERATRVTPYVGVWIETHRWMSCTPSARVTPYVGVWIETHSLV